MHKHTVSPSLNIGSYSQDLEGGGKQLATASRDLLSHATLKKLDIK